MQIPDAVELPFRLIDKPEGAVNQSLYSLQGKAGIWVRVKKSGSLSLQGDTLSGAVYTEGGAITIRDFQRVDACDAALRESGYRIPEEESLDETEDSAENATE